MAIKDLIKLKKEINIIVNNNKTTKALIKAIRDNKDFNIEITVNGTTLSKEDIDYLETKNSISQSILSLLIYKSSIYKNELVKAIENNLEID